MKIENFTLKKQITNVALTAAIVSGGGVVFKENIYAQEIEDSQVEQILDISDESFVENEEELLQQQEEVVETEVNAVENNLNPTDDLLSVQAEAQTNSLEDKSLESQNMAEDNNKQEKDLPKVSVVTNKVTEKGNPLKGAVLQILDTNGNVMDEWISDGNEHETMLPEGTYILREVKAPEGYEIAADQTFNVQVVVNEVNAGVNHDDSHDVCWHYGGVPLYYIESQGQQEEAYCVNQGWDEPNNTNYDGTVLTEDNIKNFVPDADTTMTGSELYDKILDIVYHRSKAAEMFPDLTDVEIRYVTEYALKNYTSTMVDNGMLFRKYVYDPTNPKGHYEDLGRGDAIGQLAKHWWYYHNHTVIPQRYVELYYYLTNNAEKHPEDMYLYVYSAKQKTDNGELYQNLLGVRWFDPYDDDYKVYLTEVNVAQKKKNPVENSDENMKQDSFNGTKQTLKEEKVVTNTPETNDNVNGLILPLLALGISSAGVASFAKVKKKIR